MIAKVVFASAGAGTAAGASEQIVLASEYLIPIFLDTVFAAALFSSKIKIPYTMMLVAIGIIISILSLSPSLDIVGTSFSIDPKLIIDFLIPPLIFEAMMKINYEEFKKIRLPALLLATLGVVVATLVCGFILVYFAGLPVLVAFAFSALIAPTDAAMVIEVFKKIKVPRLLSTLMESESSFNDATGIIAFSSIVALAFASGSGIMGDPNMAGAIDFNFAGEAEHFAIVFFGGAGIGLGMAAGAHRLHALMDDPFSETALTIAMVFGSMAISNAVGVSGLVAVAMAGLYFGNLTLRHENVISHKVRESAFNFWEMAAFFANSAAFLYLGATMDVTKIVGNIPLIALAFAAVLAARAASAYPILAATNRIIKDKIPLAWKHVVVLGGMRGAVSVALVASLPESEFKSMLETITFGVVLSSLVIQYIALTSYVKRHFRQDTLEEEAFKTGK
ncbi:MAG TPA: sodium:proton antiporter [Nitrososphaera sp.]|nr:sodium:proton antiporter [Nitrososphaera sp.]